jgi:hypothetical protein
MDEITEERNIIFNIKMIYSRIFVLCSIAVFPLLYVCLKLLNMELGTGWTVIFIFFACMLTAVIRVILFVVQDQNSLSRYIEMLSSVEKIKINIMELNKLLNKEKESTSIMFLDTGFPILVYSDNSKDVEILLRQHKIELRKIVNNKIKLSVFYDFYHNKGKIPIIKNIEQLV